MQSSIKPSDIQLHQHRAWAHGTIVRMAHAGYGIDDIKVRLKVKHALIVDRPYIRSLVFKTRIT